jgi:acetyltransferase-like isoleucine patch superfamily enzyme
MNSEPIHKLIIELVPEKNSLSVLTQYGLYASASIKQIGESLEYESSIRLSTAVLIGACRVGAFSYIGGGSEIRRADIGRFCSISANVAIGPAEHPVDWLSSHPFVFDGVRYFESDENWQSFKNSELRFRGNSAITEIGNDVWIGRNAIIKQGVKVGNGAIIAGGSFVSKDVPDYAIVGGVPARIIRYRFDSEIIELLKSIKWWEYKLESSIYSINFSEIRQSIDQISSLIAEGKIRNFNPKVYLLNHDNEKFKMFEVKSL